MNRKSPALLALAAALAPGCAFIPADNLRLEEARRAFDAASADPGVVRLAPAELATAGELLERASQKRDTLGDAAEVDHLAYLAKREVAIAREAAIQRAERQAWTHSRAEDR